jgi:hypothetical protein
LVNDDLLQLDLSDFQELCASDLKLVQINNDSVNDYFLYLDLSDFQEVCASYLKLVQINLQ